ncbi:Uncharacterized protein FWK35_00024330, partial [Aphis craccivora]
CSRLKALEQLNRKAFVSIHRKDVWGCVPRTSKSYIKPEVPAFGTINTFRPLEIRFAGTAAAATTAAPYDVFFKTTLSLTLPPMPEIRLNFLGSSIKSFLSQAKVNDSYIFSDELFINCSVLTLDKGKKQTNHKNLGEIFRHDRVDGRKEQ